MGVIADEYDDLDTDVSLEEFREAVEDKVEQMGGLADEETAAKLIAHELKDEEVNGIADIEPGMDEVKFLGKIVSIGELRTFERDGEDEQDGRVVNLEVADETGRIRVSLWDQQAVSAVGDPETDEPGKLDVGDVLRIAGRPKEGYNGVEVSVDKAEPDDAEIEVELQDSYRVEDISMGLSDVTLKGQILDVGSVRTFDRDDGSEGRVSNLAVGDPTGRIRVTLWDDKAPLVEEFTDDDCVEVVDGYVKERDGSLELHVGSRGAVERIDETVEYVPETTDIAGVEIGQTVDIAGGVIEADSKRTFDRDDGSEGQVRNIRIRDESGDIRVALWGEKADKEIELADRVLVTDAEIQDGYQDELEASAGWQSTVSVLESDADTAAGDTGSTTDTAADSAATNEGLSAFEDSGTDAAEATNGANGTNGETATSGTTATNGAGTTADAADTTDDAADSVADSATTDAGDATAETAAAATAGEGGDTVAATDGTAGTADGTADTATADGVAASEPEEFTGTVVQAGSPVILDNGTETRQVETDEELRLGEEVTVRGIAEDGTIDADDVF